MRNNYADKDAQPVLLADFGQPANTDVVLTVPADPDQFWAIDWILWSYDADVVGILQIEFGGVKIIEHDITRGGPGLLEFHNQSLYHADGQKEAYKNEEMKVILKGSAGAVGKLSIRYR